MIKLSDDIKSLADWCQLGFVAPDAKAMMDRLVAIGFGPFKVYNVESRNWEGVNYRGAGAQDHAF